MTQTTIGQQSAIQLVVGALLIFSLGVVVGQERDLSSSQLVAPPSAILNAAKDQPATADFGLFWEAWNKVSNKYVQTIDDKKRVYGAISGMVEGLDDPFSMFMEPRDAKKFSDEIAGNFEGIGAELLQKDGVLTVVAPLEGSPALKAGLLAGDLIVKIDQQDVPASIDDAVRKIRGPKSTTVTLTVVRNGKAQDITITRDRVEVQSVSYTQKGDVAVVKISQFNVNTADLLDTALKNVAHANAKSLVLDLRNNPGGVLDGAVAITSRFMEPGVVVIERDKDEKETALNTIDGVERVTLPMVVLINKGSASASEILAGALQDSGRAKIVGETSFGKGSVQSVEPLSDGSSLRVTIAEWLTPKKREINKVGIKPDSEVVLTEEDTKASRDPQLDKALELLK